MKKLLLYAGGAWLLLAATLTCQAADLAWNGTWKLNPSKSNLTGDTFTIRRFYSEGGWDPNTHSYTASAKPNMVYMSGGYLDYEFSCNGKSYPVIADRTISCTQSGANFDFTTTANGKVLSKYRRSLSADGQKMTVRGVIMNADGSQSSFESLYQLIDGGEGGLAGKWKSIQAKTDPRTVTYTIQGDAIRMEFPASKMVVNARLNGDFAPVNGPTVAADVTESVKAESPNKLHIIRKYKNRQIREAIQSLSADGRSITEENWDPGKTGEKETLVWEKQ